MKTHEHLNALLADYQVLYQKLRSYHWNVRGPMFFELHVKFEELYTGTAVTVDDLAERLLAIDAKPISTLQGALEVARLKEDAGDIGAQEMVANLVDDFRALNDSLRAASKAAEEEGDNTSFNLLEGIADAQEKTAWMLRSYLG